MKIARLIGGAGTGKTTELLRIMEGALPKLGNDPLRLGFASFTRAARAEAVGRAAAAWDVPPGLLDGDGWFRTVHSTCKRCLGVQPGQLLGDKKADIEWISNALGVRLSTELDDEAGRQKFIGDPVVAAALNCWSLSKNCLLPLEQVVRKMRAIDDDVPDFAAIVRVAERYELAKRLEDRLDFTDLLMRFAGLAASTTDGVYRVEPQGDLPPVEAWLFDEQQDASPLLDAVCKRLVSSPSVKWCYAVGDPMQAIYGFAGSSADCFLGWPADKERTMPKSYRCPRPILELGERCLRRMTRGYFDRGIAPADHDGTVQESGDLDDVLASVNPKDDWLFIARTNYHAGRMHAALSAAGKPARWVKSPDGPTGRSEGLKALFALERDQHVTGVEWGKAIALLPTQNADKEPMLARGVKTRWASEHADAWDCIFASDLTRVGASPALVEAVRSGAWCRLVDRGEQWRRQAAEWGADLAAEPKIRVGTIHCSPPDEPVLTTDGYIPIGEVDAACHYLCSFDRKAVRFVWGRRGRGTGKYAGRGYAFRKCWRQYQGAMLTLTTERSRTRVTPEHRVTVRFAASFINKHVVYLMRKGDCWRVGVATSAQRKPYVSGGVNGRLATEQGDAAWILSVHETKEEALLREATVQGTYGISGMRFRATNGVSSLTTEQLMEAHSAAAPFVAKRIRSLMDDYGLVEDMPLYSGDGSVTSDRAFDTAAGNVLTGYMELATIQDSFVADGLGRNSDEVSPVWLPCTKASEPYSGPVFSIEVAPHHHYVSGGAAVHNSVKGAEADNVVLLTTIGSRIEQGMENPDQADEEHRIAYVAVTRTRRNLYVVNEGRHGRQVPRMEVL